MSGLGGKFLFGLIFGAVVCTVIVVAGDAGAMRDAFIVAKWQWLVCAALCSMGVYAGRFGKWCIFLHALGIHVPIGENLGIFFSGIAMGITPGKVGEVLKSYLLREVRGVAFSRTAPTIVAERLTGVLGCMLLCLASLAVLGRGTWYSIVVCALAFAVSATVIIVFRWPAVAERVFAFLRRAPRLARIEEPLRVMYESLVTLLDARTIALCVVLSSGYWFMECLIFHSLLRAFGIDDALAQDVFVLTSVSIGGGLTLLPGSIGALEGGLIGVLVYTGAAPAIASAVTLLHRFFAMWFYVLLGAVILMLRYRRHICK